MDQPKILFKGKYQDIKKFLPKNWLDEVFLLYQSGGGEIEVTAYFGSHMGHMTATIWKDIVASYEDVRELLDLGNIVSQSWWEKQGRGDSLVDTDFNSRLWYMNMKNRFNWKDRTDITTGNEQLNQNIDLSSVPVAVLEELMKHIK